MKMRHTGAVALAAAALLAAGVVTRAQPKAAPAAEPREADLEITSEYVAWEEGRVGQQGKLYGGVEIQYRDTTFKTSEVYYRNTDQERTATSTGAVTITTPDFQLAGDRLLLDFRANRAVVTGNVRLRTKPKPAPEPAPPASVVRSSEEVTLTCDRLEYFYRIRKANASGNLAMVQGKRRFTADLAMYFLKQQVLVLDGNVKGSDERGQPHAARAVKLYLDNKERYWMEGEKYHGVLRVKEGETETEAAEPPRFPAAPPDAPTASAEKPS